jgi:inosine-uridine nucleoside N-ribohydrolase
MTTSLAQRERSNTERKHSRAPLATTAQVRTTDLGGIIREILSEIPANQKVDSRVARKVLLPHLLQKVKESVKGKQNPVVEFYVTLFHDIGGGDTVITTFVPREEQKLRAPVREAMREFLQKQFGISVAEVTSLANMAMHLRDHDHLRARLKHMVHRATRPAAPIQKYSKS